MPIVKTGGVITETPLIDKDQFDRTGVVRDDTFGICHGTDRVKQIKFDTSAMGVNSTTSIKGGATATDSSIVITLPASSGTLALAGGSSAPAFGIIQPITGTSPTAAVASDTLTLTSSDGTHVIAGNSGTDTVDFSSRVATDSVSGVMSAADHTALTNTIATASAALPKSGGTMTGQLLPKQSASLASAPQIQFATPLGVGGFLYDGSSFGFVFNNAVALKVTDVVTESRGTIATAAGSASLPSLNINGEGNTGLYYVSAGKLGFSGQGTLHSTFSSTAVEAVTGNLKVTAAGKGLSIKSGSNCKIGTAVLVGGTVTVSNTSVTANSLIFLTSQADGGTPGFLRITALTAATSFVITSSSATDTSTVAWHIIETT